MNIIQGVSNTFVTEAFCWYILEKFYKYTDTRISVVYPVITLM